VKIFLVGGLGFIGKRFIKKYANDHQLIVFAKKETIAKFRDDNDITKVILVTMESVFPLPHLYYKFWKNYLTLNC